MDEDNGLLFMRARYYRPQLGRFLTKDPIGKSNPYVYVGNEPITSIDPSGLRKVPFRTVPGASGPILLVCDTETRRAEIFSPDQTDFSLAVEELVREGFEVGEEVKLIVEAFAETIFALYYSHLPLVTFRGLADLGQVAERTDQFKDRLYDKRESYDAIKNGEAPTATPLRIRGRVWHRQSGR